MATSSLPSWGGLKWRWNHCCLGEEGDGYATHGYATPSFLGKHRNGDVTPAVQGITEMPTLLPLSQGEVTWLRNPCDLREKWNGYAFLVVSRSEMARQPLPARRKVKRLHNPCLPSRILRGGHEMAASLGPK